MDFRAVMAMFFEITLFFDSPCTFYNAIIDVRWCYCEYYKCTTTTQSAGGYCGLAWLLFMCLAGETSEKIETRSNEEAQCWQGGLGSNHNIAISSDIVYTTLIRSVFTLLTDNLYFFQIHWHSFMEMLWMTLHKMLQKYYIARKIL